MPVAAATEPGRRGRVLLIAPHGSYRTVPYLSAARALGREACIVSEGEHTLAAHDAPGLRVDLAAQDAALARIDAHWPPGSFAAVVATDDGTVELASRLAARWGLRHNPPDAVRLTRRKDLARARLREAGVPVPAFRVIDLAWPLAPQLETVQFPCVVKPVAMSASRGVIRADDPAALARACARAARIATHSERPEERGLLLVESFIPGIEIAVEGLLSRGAFSPLAVFDKPDPLDGPFFEETYYITPSRLPVTVLREVYAVVAGACRAYGLREGPVHAECRVNAAGVWILEVASRTIGGLCGRLLRFGTGLGLEELVLRHALGEAVNATGNDGAAGVLMIPIPRAGILKRIEGLGAAERVPYVEEVNIQVRDGYELVPLPEGASYLGFLFARAPSPAEAEAALRAAHAKLNIVIAPLWKIH